MTLMSTFRCCFAPNPKVNHHHDHDYHDDNNTRHESRLTMVSGSFYLPKKTPNSPFGEDAHFISSSGETIGVADGVGSWSDARVDAGVYARTLMSNAATATSSSPLLYPKEILAEAFKLSKSILLGSTTALVASHRNGVVHTANVGDSGFVVVRDGSVVTRSSPQHHSFNRPFQLGNGEGFDRPLCADEISVDVMEGDVIVAATDGVFDNVYMDDIECAVRKVAGAVEPRKLARDIGKMADKKSRDPYWNSPFSKGALAVGMVRRGGKRDDITVVVGLIVRV